MNDEVVEVGCGGIGCLVVLLIKAVIIVAIGFLLSYGWSLGQ